MTENNIQGKRILLIGLSFHNYYKHIQSELYNLGANEVKFVESKWFPEDWYLSSNKIYTIIRLIINPFFRIKYTNKVISELSGNSYDVIFSFAAFTLSEKLIKHLKKQNPKLISTIFYWDSFHTWNLSHTMKYFDNCYSFDKRDCDKYDDLKYYPDFYLPANIEIEQSEDKYYLSHIGSTGPRYIDRLIAVKKLIRVIAEKKITSYIFLYSPSQRKWKQMLFSLFSWRQFKYLILSQKYKKLISHQIITLQEVQDVERNSRAILDLPVKTQHGTTIRVLTAIANRKKIITSNKHIINEKFYNPNNILIIDNKTPEIDLDFFNKPYIPVDISYLRIDNWLKYILNNES